MRKVIYKEWVPGKLSEGTSAIFEPGRNVENEGLFHGFFPVTIENNDGSFGNFTEALIEIEDGSIVSVNPSNIRFIDKPEDEQLAEFTKAAMQGLCSSFVNDETDRDEYNYAAMSVMVAKATISELKKQKP